MTNCSKCGHVNKPAARFCAKCGNAMLGAAAPAVAHQPTGMLPATTMLGGRYVILRRLGSGGMAAVYQAQDFHLPGKYWAIKEMSDSSLTTPAERAQAVASFEREALVLSHLSHPNIVRVHDRFPQDGRYYLVMDFVDGATLDDILLQRGNALDEAQVLTWLHQLCAALSYLHGQNPPIIFRDLKPGNIMVDKTGAIKLIDFGIARQFDPAKHRDTTMLGTQGYAPPEQYGKGQTDARSDIYALGVTMHRLLTGHDPSSTPFNLPPVRNLNSGVSSELSNLVEQCIQADTSRRPQRVIDIQNAVTGMLGARYATQPPAAGVPQAPVVQISKRPTTRLVQAAAKLTNRQLIYVGVGALIAAVLGVLLLGPWLSANLTVVWTGLPAYFLAGPTAYAATRRMGVAFVVQCLFTILIVMSAWMTTGSWITGTGSYTAFLLGVLLSAAALEVGFYLLDQRWQWKNQPDMWKREAAWYALTTLVAVICFFVPWWSYNTATSIWYWPSALVIGALGWFLGDLLREGKLQRFGKTP
jgi:serine/threonine-protein kinase